MQRTKKSIKKTFALAVIPVIVAAMLVPTFTNKIEPQAAATTNTNTVKMQIHGTQAPQFAPSQHQGRR